MAAMSSIASSTVLSLAVRPIASPRIRSLSIINNTVHNAAREHGAVKTGISNFCTDSRRLIDYKLITSVNSQIKSEKNLPPVPDGFPFTIRDPYNRSCIYLRREIDGEKIEIKVETPHQIKYTHGSFAESTADLAPSVMLHVTISKEKGKLLKFEVSSTSDDIRVTRLSVEEPEKFSPFEFGLEPYLMKDGDVDLQLALREFLEIRGVDKKYVDYLYKYMVRVYTRRYGGVLEKLNTFVKE